MKLRAIMVCVDYADLLVLTLPLNRPYFSEVMIVTTPGDVETQRVAEANGCKVHKSSLFYADGAHFNKWRALEEGLDAFGRHGWLSIMDADIVWPPNLCFTEHNEFGSSATKLELGKLYTPRRHMLTDLSGVLVTGRVPPWQTWSQHPLHRVDFEWSGYTQVFNANDPVLGKAPWHQIDWKHAGGADSFFQAKWKPENKIRPNFTVLHLGQAGQNWFGRASQRLDGTTPAFAEKAKVMTDALWNGRRGKVGDRRFDGEKIRIV